MKLKTIKSREIFSALRQSGKSARNESFRIVFLEGVEFQVGFVMPKALGNAVKRNKLRRRMTEAIKVLNTKMPFKIGAYLFKPFGVAIEMNYIDVQKKIDDLMIKSNFYLQIREK